MTTKKKAAAANTKATAATEKKAVVKAPVSKPAKTEMVAIFKTTYGYYRYWLRHTEMAALSNTGLLKTRIVMWG
jgi:hypothetical protein